MELLTPTRYGMVTYDHHHRQELPDQSEITGQERPVAPGDHQPTPAR